MDVLVTPIITNGAVVLLFGIIVKNIYSKLDGMQTTKMCNEKHTNVADSFTKGNERFERTDKQFTEYINSQEKMLAAVHAVETGIALLNQQMETLTKQIEKNGG